MQMTGLKRLNISRCFKLRELPACPSTLDTLEIGDCSLEKLPDSFHQLRMLKFLYAGHCQSLTAVPASLHEVGLLRMLPPCALGNSARSGSKFLSKI